MSITGNLSDFSLSEIFQLLAKGHKTGLLTLRRLPASGAKLPQNFYIWIKQGCVVAAANQLNQKCLMSVILQYPWVSDRVLDKLVHFCPTDQPLGIYLRQQGVLQTGQLEHLFQVQIVQQLSILSKLNDAWFSFEQNASIPNLEMTGLSLSLTFLEEVLQKILLLQKISDARKWQQKSGFSSYSGSFCQQIIKTLDIAFFHSLQFSLFDNSSSLGKLSQVLELDNFPYDLPKFSVGQTLFCTIP